MRYISLFSGIEAATVAWRPLGWQAVAFSEIEPFPCALLEQRYPSVPNVGDVTAHDWSQYRGRADLVIGGPPCQDFSTAGLGASMAGHRGQLSLAYVEAVHAIDPLWSVTENVPGWLSRKDNAFGQFLARLVGEDAAICPPGGKWTDAGVVDGPRRTAAWRILDAQYFGLAQRRERVIVLSARGSGNWHCAAALFPVGEGMSRYPAPRRETGSRAAGVSAAGVGGGGGWRIGADEAAAELPADPPAPCIAFDTRQTDVCVYGDTAGTVSCQEPQQGVTTPYGVRRITPEEAEALQGFPRGHTAITYRGKPAADGPRYRAIGNSMPVPVIRWLGERIEMVGRVAE